MDEEQIKRAVRDQYARIADGAGTCCGPSCCEASSAGTRSRQLGYSDDELAAVPEGADLGLGCGTPVAISGLEEGHTVVDLGSGAGFDCFLAAKKVGPAGRVIGVDMTHEMLEKARDNAARSGCENVEFRLGELEHLPVADGEVDVVISNCVINLVPDKKQVFSEAFRVLKPGGRLMVSDMVLLGAWPQGIEKSLAAYAGCLAGAELKEAYLAAIEGAGFADIRVLKETGGDDLIDESIDELLGQLGVGQDARQLAGLVASVTVSATKPRDR